MKGLVFKLYGEDLAWPTLDLLHIESIPVRNRPHHGEIHPHRHGDLFQLPYVQQQQAQLSGRLRALERVTCYPVGADAGRTGPQPRLISARSCNGSSGTIASTCR
ncbi:hypothetical protein GCM10027514_39930 [Azotobacter armeniacus]